MDTIRETMEARAEITGSLPASLVSAFARSYGVMWLAVPMLLARAGREARLASTYLVPVFAGLAVATHWIRVLAGAFPVVLPLVVAVRFGRRTGAVFATAYAVHSLVVAPRSGSATKYLAELVVMAIAAIALLAAVRRGGIDEPRLTEPSTIDHYAGPTRRPGRRWDDRTNHHPADLSAATPP